MAADSAAALGADDPGDAEQTRLRRRAGVRSQVASWISGLMQGNTASCDDLRRRLAALRVPGGPPSAAAVEPEIQALDRDHRLAGQDGAWHLGEARRLLDLAGRANRPEGPAAAAAPGRTISGDTTRQPDGCGQVGGA